MDRKGGRLDSDQLDYQVISLIVQLDYGYDNLT